MLENPDKTARPARVLLVEDNRCDEELTLRVLRSHPLAGTVMVARDGVQALECLVGGSACGGTLTGLPEVILLDLRLPKADGVTVLERIRRDPHTRDIPVFILLSSQCERQFVDRRGVQPTGYIVKPVGHDNFTQAMRSIGYDAGRNERETEAA